MSQPINEREGNASMEKKSQRKTDSGDASRTGIGKEQREHRRRERGKGATADWNDADPNKLVRAILAVTGLGCAIQLGYTRDGSAFVVRIVGDGEPYNDYVRPTEDINLYLDALSMDYAK